MKRHPLLPVQITPRGGHSRRNAKRTCYRRMTSEQARASLFTDLIIRAAYRALDGAIAEVVRRAREQLPRAHNSCTASKVSIQ